MVKRFYENGMTVNDLKVLLERAIEQGYGDAHIQVQADADSISDIMINGYEGFGEEFENGQRFSQLFHQRIKLNLNVAMDLQSSLKRYEK